MDPSPITYSTLSPAAVISQIFSAYDLGSAASCDFFARGLNDTFRVQTPGERYALRIYRYGWRSLSDVEYEIDALLHLDRKGVPVAKPLARRDGKFISTVEQPEGRRYAVLFAYAEGAEASVNGHTEAQARSFGRASAVVHRESDDFISGYRRFELDLNHLIDTPLSTTLPFLEHRPDDQRYLREFASKIRQRIESVRGQLDFGFCHGDLHGMNATFSDDKVTMFDFDCGGPGWRAYDIAVYRWSCDLRSKADNWKIFLEAYQQSRPLALIDMDAIPLFVGARHLWIMGVHTSSASVMGRNWLSDQYFDYWLKFIRDLEAKELGG